MPAPTPTDLGLMLGEDVDTARAEFLIGIAMSLAAQYIDTDPLPASANAVILTAVSRQYANPTGVTAESIGPTSYQRPNAGIYFTKSEERALLRSAGMGGAFTVDPTPLDAGDMLWDSLPFGPSLDWA